MAALSSRQMHRVYLFDCTGEVSPRLVFSHANKSMVKRWVRRWQRDSRGMAAVIWPIGAAAPKAVIPKQQADLVG